MESVVRSLSGAIGGGIIMAIDSADMTKALVSDFVIVSKFERME